MENYERHQALLLLLREVYSGGNSTRLAEQINKDATYVRRLFYPRDKAGAKGIGPDFQAACTRAFGLPRGFWEMGPDEAADALQGREVAQQSGAPETSEGRSTPQVSSESFPQYVRDVSISVEGFAQLLNDHQRAALRNTLKVMLSDRLNFVNLDLNHLLPLLSDNAYARRLGKGPGQPLQPIRSPASQSVTNVIDLGAKERTDGEGTPPRPGGGKRGH